MKQGIHPEYMECTVKCSCGNTFETKSTKPELKIDICNACHPFYTGQQRFVDTGGRVQRFANKFGGSATNAVAEREAARKAARANAVAEAEAKKKAEREAKAAEKAKRAEEFAKKAEAEAKKAAAAAAAAAEAAPELEVSAEEAAAVDALVEEA